MNERERDRFYRSAGSDWDDDGVELDVEPPDADVIAHEKRRAEKLVEVSEMSIDVDEIYRDLEQRDTPALPFKLPEKIRFQFQVKHILIATAVLAVVLTMWRLHILANVGGVLVLAIMGGALAYIEFKEQERCLAAERIWQAKLERRRRYFEVAARARDRKPGEPATIYDDVPFDGSAPAEEPPVARQPLRFQFSLRQLFVAMTLAAVALGFVHLIGAGAGIIAMLLGSIAFGGLVVHAIGVEVPQFVVLGWWMVLVLYILLGLVTEIQNAF